MWPPILQCFIVVGLVICWSTWLWWWLGWLRSLGWMSYLLWLFRTLVGVEGSWPPNKGYIFIQ